MSQVKIQGNASGTGIFTIASPNSNSNRTLDLPDNSGTVMTSASALTVSQLPAQFSINSGAPAGSFVMDSAGRITTPNQPAFRAVRTSSFTTTANVWTDIVYNSNITDISNSYSTTTGRFTAPVTGAYFFSASSQPFTSGYLVNQQFWVNGSAVSNTAISWNLLPARGDMVMAMLVRLTAGDYIQVRVETTNNMTYDNNGQFSGFLIG